MVTQKISHSPRIPHNFLWPVLSSAVPEYILNLRQAICVTISLGLEDSYQYVERNTAHIFSEYTRRRFLRDTDKKIRNKLALEERKMEI